MTDRNDRIREVAYFLWLEDGCPEGQAERHWSTAEALLASDEFERKQIEGEPPGDPAGDSQTASGLPGPGATSQILRRRGAAWIRARSLHGLDGQRAPSKFKPAQANSNNPAWIEIVRPLEWP
jgi:hypothetical protein